MKIAIMQPYLFPYIGYFQLINAVEKFVILDTVSYIKKGWINRNRILVNGTPHLFTISIKAKSQNILIKDILLDNDKNDVENLLKTIYLNYKKAPYFKNVYELIEESLMKKHNKIVDLILSSIGVINHYLDISTKIIHTSTGYNTDISGQERIIKICNCEKATHYINPIGGIELYNNELFSRNGLELSFLKTKPLEYKQFANIFEPNLSIVDLLMFNSPDKVAEMLMEYELWQK
ncbi:MAG: WbqC family protein [Lachnospiraceae bacterium]|nr:WbqC family protein [Lachnospiraceae bacterium]